MAKPLSIQLYSVREELKADYAGTIAKIASYGYVAVEPCGLPEGMTAANTAKLYADNGLYVSTYQGGTPVGDNANALLDAAEGLGTKHVVCPYHDPKSFESMDGIKANAEMFSQAITNAAQRGMTFGYHNHDFELQLVDGKPALLIMADLVGENLYNTVDTYWVAVGGQDPVDIITKLGARANILHIKDGPLDKEQPMTAVGAGKMDFAPIVAAGEANAKFMVVEIDRCDGDMMEAVEASAKYLLDNGLAAGR